MTVITTLRRCNNALPHSTFSHVVHLGIMAGWIVEMTIEQQDHFQEMSHRISELCGQVFHGRICTLKAFVSVVKEIYDLNVAMSAMIKEAHTI